MRNTNWFKSKLAKLFWVVGEFSGNIYFYMLDMLLAQVITVYINSIYEVY